MYGDDEEEEEETGSFASFRRVEEADAEVAWTFFFCFRFVIRDAERERCGWVFGRIDRSYHSGRSFVIRCCTTWEHPIVVSLFFVRLCWAAVVEGGPGEKNK